MNLLREKLVGLKNKFGKRAATLALAGVMAVGGIASLASCDAPNFNIFSNIIKDENGKMYTVNNVIDKINYTAQVYNSSQGTPSTSGEIVEVNQSKLLSLEELSALYDNDVMLGSNQKKILNALQTAFPKPENLDHRFEITLPVDEYSYDDRHALSFLNRIELVRKDIDPITREISHNICAYYWNIMIPENIYEKDDGRKYVDYYVYTDFDMTYYDNQATKYSYYVMYDKPFNDLTELEKEGFYSECSYFTGVIGEMLYNGEKLSDQNHTISK